MKHENTREYFIEINDKDKEVVYSSIFKLLLGYILTIIIFPISFLLISVFIFLVCIWEGMKSFFKGFKETIEYTRWCEGAYLVLTNMRSILFYKKRKQNK